MAEETSQNVPLDTSSNWANKKFDIGGRRLDSLDALRGFSMVWIIGGAPLVGAIATAISVVTGHPEWHNTIDANVAHHLEWQGFHFSALVLPLFLFMMGVSLPFSFSRRIEAGNTRADMARYIIRRTIGLFFLGLVYNGLLQLPGIEYLRIMGVLQRLALAFGCAALIFLFFHLRGQIVIAISLLLIYWIVMRWVPVPGHPLGSFTQDGNVASYLDRLVFLPGQLYTKAGDPEGLLSTIPSITTALLESLRAYGSVERTLPGSGCGDFWLPG